MKFKIFMMSMLFVLSSFGLVIPSYSSNYLVDDGDVLQITVYDHVELSTTVMISSNGSITFPLLGQLQVVGTSIPQISAMITNLLADGFIVNPQVNVFITKFRNQNIFVNGQVKKPGVIQFEDGMTLIKVISLSGGFTDTADDKQISITRRQNDQEVTVKDPDLNCTIQPGDVISVPIIIKDQNIFVSGQVQKPGSFPYDRDNEMTLLKIISLAGGFNDVAAKGRISVVRRVNGKEVTLEKVKLSELILPGDVIIVPESFF